MTERLPVNEIFATIQGEAFWTGTPSTFVRLQGCAVGCPWCDTKHTWKLENQDQVSFQDMLAKREDSAKYALASVEQIVRQCGELGPKHVVITGGEPCDYDLRELVIGLSVAGMTVQIETSGTSEIRAGDAWVTVSPKVNMPGGKIVRDDALRRANEIKMPVGKPGDLATLQTVLHSMGDEGTKYVWLQPLSLSPKATKLCVEAALAHGWRVSLQTHKYLGVR